MQSQESLNVQLDKLSEYAKNEGMGAKTLSRILHGNLSPLVDTQTRSELIKSVSIANKEGLYDVADHIRYKILGLK
jgi:hypothetical protein